MQRIAVKTSHRTEFIDITRRVQELVQASGVRSGICVVYVPHTTAACTVNENADPDVARDILARLATLIPEDANYQHIEGNADSHIKATWCGQSETLIIEDGRIQLGRWQGIFFCEFDGPRNREVWIKIIPAPE